MTTNEFDLSESELSNEDILVLEDSYFDPEIVVIVTGGASGIGRATAVALAMNGLTVVSADIDEDGLVETKALAVDPKAPSEIVVAPTDLTDDGDIEAVIETATDAGELQFVANIAGIQQISSLSEFSMEKYDHLLDIMLRASFHVAKLIIPHIRESDDGVGAIGNMSSIHRHYVPLLGFIGGLLVAFSIGAPI